MDQHRFDDLTRSLSANGWTRRELARGAGRAFAALGLGALASGLAATRAKPKKGKKGKKKKKKKPPTTGCSVGTKACQGACIPAADCCPQPDTQTCQGRCGNIPNNCGQSVACGGCPAGESCTAGGQCEPDDACGANQIDCGGGLCIPDVEDACCAQADCGPSSLNDLVCNTDSHRCECFQDGWGICQRFASGSALCGACCPGSVYGIGDRCVRPADDRICVNQTMAGCTCPPEKPLSCNSPGFGVRCRADGNDPRACGNSCETCDDHECCINGHCLNKSGCPPGWGGGICMGNPCGSCTFFCPPETPMCCAVGPAAVPTCVASTLCP
jgi:hypothetical protein